MGYPAKKNTVQPNLRRYSNEVLVKALTEDGADATKAIEHLYRKARPVLVYQIMKGKDAEEESWDILQEGMLILIQNLRRGKYAGSSSIQTYLLGICRHIWMEQLGKKDRERERARQAAEADPEFARPATQSLMAREQSEVLQELFERLPARCGDILKLFYWECFSLEAIALRLGFKNEGSVKARKYKCQLELMKILKQHPRVLHFLNDMPPWN